MRQVQGDHALLEEHRLHLEVLEQVAGRLADVLGVEGDLVVAAEVHEDEVLALAVEELRLPLVDLGGRHRLAAPPGLREASGPSAGS